MMVSALTILGALCLVGGGVGYFTFPAGLSFGLKKMINLDQNGMVYPLYMNPPFATRSEFRLFEITNPREVLRGGKMQFRVRGPYLYDTRIKRDNIMFLDSNQRVRYDSHRKLYAREDISADFEEKMWLLNPIIPGTWKTVRSMIIDRIPFRRISEPIVFNAVNVLLDNFKERLIVRTTPRIFLDGRQVEMLEAISNLAARFGLSSLIPPGPPQNTFGLAYVQNETVDQLEIYTGVGESQGRYGDVTRWKDKQRVDVWQGACSRISGTNGEIYRPMVNTSAHLRVFIGPLCRSLTLLPASTDGPRKSNSGLLWWEFELNPSIFLGARNNPKNQCYCEDTRSFDCQLDGLLSMGPCFFNSPLYFARGNMKGMDSRIRGTTDYDKTVNATTPDRQVIALDQTTGTVLGVDLTLLAVFKVVKQEYMRDLARIQNLTYVPAFAATESIEVPFKYVWQVRLLQLLTGNYGPIMLGTSAVGGGMLLFKYLFGGH